MKKLSIFVGALVLLYTSVTVLEAINSLTLSPIKFASAKLIYSIYSIYFFT